MNNKFLSITWGIKKINYTISNKNSKLSITTCFVFYRHVHTKGKPLPAQYSILPIERTSISLAFSIGSSALSILSFIMINLPKKITIFLSLAIAIVYTTHAHPVILEWKPASYSLQARQIKICQLVLVRAFENSFRATMRLQRRIFQNHFLKNILYNYFYLIIK